MFTGRAALPPLEASSVADYGNLFNPDGQQRVPPAAAHATRHAQSEMKRQLLAEIFQA
jgi:hypothetical protein